MHSQGWESDERGPHTLHRAVDPNLLLRRVRWRSVPPRDEGEAVNGVSWRLIVSVTCTQENVVELEPQA